MRLKVSYLVFSILFAVFGLGAVEPESFLTDNDVTLFYKQGYLLKSGCFSQEEMDQLSEDVTAAIEKSIEEIYRSKEPIFSEEDQILYINGSRVVYKRRLDESISIARINGCGGIQPDLLSTIRSNKMVNTFFKLLGTNDLEHLISQIHPKLPGDGIAFPRHRDIQFRKSFDPDWEDVLGNGSYAICIIPIDRMTPDNGGLWIDRNNYPKDQGVEEDLVWLYAEPGDLLFIHPHLYHGSGPNFAPNSSRKTLLTGFCAFGANHKPYPGAYVNTRFTLREEGNIEMSASPWSEGLSLGLGSGH